MLYQTHARIHLDNIRFNIEGIRQAIGPERKILIAVKANAYGHGAVEVSRLAESIGVDWLGVATVPEGLQLRQAGIRLPILKFSPAFPEEMESAVRSGITLTVCERANVDALEQVCRAANLQADVHLKVETGMGRIGVSAAEAPALAAHIERNCPNLQSGGHLHPPAGQRRLRPGLHPRPDRTLQSCCGCHPHRHRPPGEPGALRQFGGGAWPCARLAGPGATGHHDLRLLTLTPAHRAPSRSSPA